jgi:methionyl-tRNA synthetase
MTTGLTIADFKKCELRTAKIVSAEAIEGADKLWRLELEVGAEKKQIVAGIKKAYPDKTALVGKTIVIVHNLEPAVIRGVESRGMLLAAKDGDNLTLLTLDKELPSGSLVG